MQLFCAEPMYVHIFIDLQMQWKMKCDTLVCGCDFKVLNWNWQSVWQLLLKIMSKWALNLKQNEISIKYEVIESTLFFKLEFLSLCSLCVQCSYKVYPVACVLFACFVSGEFRRSLIQLASVQHISEIILHQFLERVCVFAYGCMLKEIQKRVSIALI